jgi:cobalt transporter subunit CbtA
MFSKIVTSALFAGFAAGLIAGLLQLNLMQPVLLHAELYETGQLVHFGGPGNVPAAQETGGFNLTRDGLSILFVALAYTGFAFLLVAAMAAASDRGATINARTGLIWGLAGFIAFQLAPGAGLPPEVPGAAAAEMGARQLWWFSTIAATALALAMIAFGRNPLVLVAAVVLLLAPHVIGAPHPDAFAGTAPPELAGLFAARSLAVALAGWALLGMFAGYFWSRAEAEVEAAA